MLVVRSNKGNDNIYQIMQHTQLKNNFYRKIFTRCASKVQNIQGVA